MAFNENTRVKIPAILHLCRLGYQYVSLSKATWDLGTNIFTDIFAESLLRINKDLEAGDIKRIFDDVSLALDAEDLGQSFFEMLTTSSGTRLIDFSSPENFAKNNSFHVVTELTYKNGDDEFRPDITLLINGMPLAFIEVKKPNNQEGIVAERDRINVRFKNKKFRKFINISQVLVFSNNMEYDNESIEPIQGAFYSSTSNASANFNNFREEEQFDLIKLLKPEDNDLENLVLKDNNLSSIKHSPEFITNKEPNSPTNRILNSLFSAERLYMLLKYCFAYVNSETGLEKHIMRYPQLFATKAIERTLDNGIRKGIIWHTQGSGKTALAFYNVLYLTDYFQKKSIIPKFYFIVDRIDLMNQAKTEFSSRGLVVHTVNSKDELIKNFKEKKAIHNLSGKREITVVNIQKFKDDTDILKANDYDINTQRIYFLDEVHRSYNPSGNFLANLVNSDRNAILIGLTGTPLIGTDRRSRDTFGDYIHKYYYNASIADGYTLKLIREGIETKYKIQLEQALKDVEILKGAADKRKIYAHGKFVEPMLDYIVQDFLKSRIRFGDHTIGGMVVCDSSQQARKLFEIFISKYNPDQKVFETIEPYMAAAEPSVEYGNYRKDQNKRLTASLILHDIGSKDDRKDQVTDFKTGKIDLLFVYNMLLTGFDAKRLKKLYIGRIVKDHNLLQTLTMVTQDFTAQTKELIDNLKGVCTSYGLGNDGNEFKIITQIFLYKFMNDKFGYEVKQIDSVKTGTGAKITLFDELSNYITDSSQRDNFCKALVNQLVNFSFEKIFSQKFDFFSTIFEYLIKDYNKDGGGKYAEYYTPHAVAKIMASILVDGPVSNVTCCDPSAGSGTLLMNLAHAIGEDRCTIYSQDISQKSSSMLRLNLILNNLVHSIQNIIQGNTIKTPYHKVGDKLMTFDYIVSNPPFKLDFSDYVADLDSKQNKERFFAGFPNVPKKDKDKMAIYPLFIQHIMFTLSAKGKAAIVVPTGFITAQSGIEKRIRERLVEEKMLRGVVSMPSNIFATTGTNVSILFIDKANTKGDIVLMDASKLGTTVKDGKNQKTLLSDDEEDLIISSFNEHKAVEDFTVVVSYEQIKEKNYSFSAGQYFDVKIEYTDITPEEFTAKMDGFRKNLDSLFADSANLEVGIKNQLEGLKYE